jgi:hypothetical protein
LTLWWRTDRLSGVAPVEAMVSHNKLLDGTTGPGTL